MRLGQISFIAQNLERIQNILKKVPTIKTEIMLNQAYIQSDYLMRALLIMDEHGILPDEAVDLEIASWLHEGMPEYQVDKMIFEHVNMLKGLHLLETSYLTLHRLSGGSVSPHQKNYAILTFLRLFSDNRELCFSLSPRELWVIFVKITDIQFLDSLHKINIEALNFFNEHPDADCVFRVLCVSPLIDEICLDILLFTFKQLKKYGEFNTENIKKLFQKVTGFVSDSMVKTINDMRGMISCHCLLSVSQLSFWNPTPEFVQKIKDYPEAAYIFFQSGYSLSKLMAAPSEIQDDLLNVFHETAFVKYLVQDYVDPSEFLEFNNIFSRLINHFSKMAVINNALISQNKINWIIKALNFTNFKSFYDICCLFECVFVANKAVPSKQNIDLFFDESFFNLLIVALTMLVDVYGGWEAMDCEKLRPIYNFYEMSYVYENDNSVISWVVKILSQLKLVNDLNIEVVSEFLDRLHKELEKDFEFARLFFVNYWVEISEFCRYEISDEIQEKMRKEPENFYLLCTHATLSLSRFSLLNSDLQDLLLDNVHMVIFLYQKNYFTLDQLLFLYEKNQPAFYELVSSEGKPAFDSKIAHARMILDISQPDIVRPSQSGMFSSSFEASDDGSTDFVCGFP